MNIEAAIKLGCQQLVGLDSAKLDTILLLSFLLNKPSSFIRAFSETQLTSLQMTDFLNLIQRRVSGEPLAYLIGQQEFWSLPLSVSPTVLVPRPETECLVQAVLDCLPFTPLTIADFGTGSGAIAIALAHERPKWHLIATDISAQALELAQHNARYLHLENIQFVLSDWGQNLTAYQFDAIISNPPYIAVNDAQLEKNVKKFEPELALFAADNGFAAFITIIQQAKKILKPGGYLFLEHGATQQAKLSEILQAEHFTVLVQGCDLAQLPRYIVAQIN